MIGLKRHTVRVVEHHPGWAARAEQTCRELRRAGGDLIVDAQHVGSTAVPGLPAKPILDIAVAVAKADAVPELVRRLAEAGYVYRGDAADEGGHLFVRESSPEVRTAHVHVVALEDSQWRDYLRFRDLLRQDAEIRREYAELKRQLAARHAGERKAYTAAKNNFVRAVLSAERQAQPETPEDGRRPGR